MAPPFQNTVDRLDKPSSYGANKVGEPNPRSPYFSNDTHPQTKRRRFNRDGEGRDRERSPDPRDRLKDATTLYVGNLYDPMCSLTTPELRSD